MALHVIADSTKPVVRDLHRYLRLMQEGADGLTRVLSTMTQLSDGTRTDAGDFDLLATQGGYSAGDYATANAAAKASFDELNSVVGIYNTATKAALDQAVAIHGLS